MCVHTHVMHDDDARARNSTCVQERISTYANVAMGLKRFVFEKINNSTHRVVVFVHGSGALGLIQQSKTNGLNLRTVRSVIDTFRPQQ